jgi:hypothetical protein
MVQTGNINLEYGVYKSRCCDGFRKFARGSGRVALHCCRRNPSNMMHAQRQRRCWFV